jgi:hypothetical protein
VAAIAPRARAARTPSRRPDIALYASGEKALAAERLDRGFYSFKLWMLACASDAALLCWRTSRCASSWRKRLGHAGSIPTG